jgi:predicted nucleic acid-binding protein
VLYADASALVKLVLDEPESAALSDYLGDDPEIATSRLALVEVTRAIKVANDDPEVHAEAASLFDRCLLLDVDDPVLDRAAQLSSIQLRALDAVHLASALQVGSEELVAYDRRLVEAAGRAGLRTASPGT